MAKVVAAVSSLMSLAALIACGGAAAPPSSASQMAQVAAGDSLKTRNHGRIAFQQWTPLSDVWTMNPDGTGAVNLTHVVNPGWAAAASFSFDGRKIAYSTADGFCYGSQDIWIVVMDADGGHKTCLPNGDNGTWVSWSPNGKKLIFTNNADGKLYAIRADGKGTATALTSGPSYDWAAHFSPSGERIVFTSDRAGGTTCPAGGGCLNLFTMRADGSDVTKLTDDSLDAFAPSWSPEGDRIAFSSNYSSPNSALFTIRPNGKGLKALTSGPSINDAFPVYSPDGKRIVFTGCSDPACTQNIFTIAADGSDRTQLTFDTNTYPAASSWGPACDQDE